MSRDDMDKVLDEGIRFASHLLKKYGEFYPFGVVKSVDGEISHIQGHIEGHPPSDELIDLITDGLRQGAKAGRYLTTAVVSDIRLRNRALDQTKDAIRVDIEDNEQHAVTCYVPYVMDDSNLNLGDIMAELASPTIFLKL